MSKPDRHSQALIEFGHELGWTSKGDGLRTGSVRLSAPPPYQGITVDIAINGCRISLQKSIAKKIIRYGEPDKYKRFIAREGLGYIARDLLKITPEMVRTETRLKPDALAMDVTEPESISNPTIVEEKPWLAHGSASAKGGRRYASKTTVERTWSDGTVDYACAIADCDFVDKEPNPVARHYGRTKKDHPPVGSGGEQNRNYVDPSYTEPINPSPDRSARLRSQLKAVLDSLGDLATYSKESLAAELAKEITKSRELAHDLIPVNNEPRSDAELIEAIRHLVDRGEYLTMRDEISTLRVSLSEQSERAKKFEDRWNTYRELVMEEA